MSDNARGIISMLIFEHPCRYFFPLISSGVFLFCVGCFSDRIQFPLKTAKAFLASPQTNTARIPDTTALPLCHPERSEITLRHRPISNRTQSKASVSRAWIQAYLMPWRIRANKFVFAKPRSTEIALGDFFSTSLRMTKRFRILSGLANIPPPSRTSPSFPKKGWPPSSLGYSPSL